MGTYNRISIRASCPRCLETVDLEVDLHLGFTSRMLVMRLGDRYPFHERRMPHNGGPVEGVVEGAGYTECLACHRDFFCDVEIVHGVLRSVSPSQAAPPYSADRIREPAGACPSCGSSQTRHFEYDNMTIGWFLCDSSTCAFRVTTLDPERRLYVGDQVEVPMLTGFTAPDS